MKRYQFTHEDRCLDMPYSIDYDNDYDSSQNVFDTMISSERMMQDHHIWNLPVSVPTNNRAHLSEFVNSGTKTRVNTKPITPQIPDMMNMLHVLTYENIISARRASTFPHDAEIPWAVPRSCVPKQAETLSY